MPRWLARTSRLLLFAAGVLHWSIAPAQSPELDAALTERVTQAPANQRSALYLEAARAAKLQNLDRAQALARLAIEAATTEAGAAFEALLLLVDLELTGRKPEAAALNLDALEQASASDTLRSRQAPVRYLRGRWLRDQRQDDQALIAFKQAIELANANNDDLTAAKALHAEATMLIRQGAQTEAEQLLERALQLNTAAGRERDADANRHYLGLIARDRGDYSWALSLHLEALAHSEARGDQQGIANSANAIGILQAHQEQNDQALVYYQKALDAFRELHDRYGEVNALANIAEIYSAMSRWQEAEQQARLGVEIAVAEKDDDAEALARLILAKALAGQKRYADAEREATRAVELTATLPADLRLQQALVELAHTYEAQGRLHEEIPLLARALAIAQATGRSLAQRDALLDLARVEKQVGDTANAYDHLSLAFQLSQSLRDAEMTRQLAEMRAQHEAETRDAEITAQQAQIGVLEAQADQQQRIRYLLALALATAALLVLALISRARTKLAAERELKAQNALIEKANRELAVAAETDTLTQIPNRRHFQRVLIPAITAAQANGRRYTLILIDADRFKSINDVHGHDCGDDALVAIVNAWRSVLQPDQTMLRWGGEEFLAVVFDLDEQASAALVGRGLAAVRAAKVQGRNGPLALSVSAGWVCGPWPGAELGWLLQLADRVMLQAKRDGRDRGYGMVWREGAATGGALPDALVGLWTPGLRTPTPGLRAPTLR